MNATEVVKAFYESDLANSTEVIDLCFSRNCKIHWHGSNGFSTINYDGFKALFEEIKRAYQTLRFEISHFLQDGNRVVVRYTSYVTTIENPNEEQALAHFFAIWKVSNGKIIEGHQMSQLADNSSESLNSFS